MTKLLVSVRSAAEAEVALSGGADVIDVKEPRRGAMGPAEPAVWREVQNVVGQRAILSVALGDLLDDPAESLAAAAFGFSFAKIGLQGVQSSSSWKDRWHRVATALPDDTQIVPVAYADWQGAESLPVNDVMMLATQLPARLLLIDTWNKQAGRLTDHLSLSELSEVIESAHRYGAQVALAGSLQLEDIQNILPCAPAYIGVRGAACSGGRHGPVELARVKSLSAIVREAKENVSSRCLTTPRARRILPCR